MMKQLLEFIDSLVFYEMDEIESQRMRRKPKIVPFYRSEKSAIFRFDMQDFILNRFMKVIKTIDSYGSAIFEYEGEEIIILNTYEEEDIHVSRFEKTKFSPVITFCIIYKDKIEVADIVTTTSLLPRKRLKIMNHMGGKIPSEIAGVTFGGKRAFYFCMEERFVSLRVKSTEYKDVPEQFKHKAAEGWASSPRVMVHLHMI